MSAKVVKPKPYTKRFLETPYVRVYALLVIIMLVGGALFVTNRKGDNVMYAHKTACDLFTLNDAKKILGADTTSSSFPDDGMHTADIQFDSTSCGYDHSGIGPPGESYLAYEKGVSKILSINATDGHNTKSITYIKDGFTKGKSLVATTPITGLGDDAYYSDGGVAVLYSNYTVEVSYSERANTATEQKYNETLCIQIARQIITNIKK